MFLRLLHGRPILVPHGGLVVGSYGHVDDLCAAMLVIATHPAAAGEIFNVSTDGVDVNRYISVLAGVVGAEPDVVRVPDEFLARIETPVFGHLFSVRHHAIVATHKAEQLLGVRPRYGLAAGHAHTYEWFQRQGWGTLDAALVDPIWKASWDFAAEANLAEMIRRG